MFVTFEVVDLGIVIQWDKGNRLYIRLQPNWKGHTSGLCGNFNQDSLDDFQTPSGILEASPEIFGDSWKLHRYCPKAAIIHVRILLYSNNMNKSFVGHLLNSSTQEAVVNKKVWHSEVRCL